MSPIVASFMREVCRVSAPWQGRMRDLANVGGARGRHVRRSPGRDAGGGWDRSVIGGLHREEDQDEFVLGLVYGPVCPGLEVGGHDRVVAGVDVLPGPVGGLLAAAIAFLAGPSASFITGQSLHIDGGWLLH